MCMESCFPDRLKYVEVAALLKGLDNLNEENYRPVRVSTALSKLQKYLKKVSFVQMSSYFYLYSQKFCPVLDLHIAVKPFY